MKILGGMGGLWKSKRGQLTIAVLTCASVMLWLGKIDQDTWAMLVGAQGGLYTLGNSYENAAAAKSKKGE